MYKRSVEQIKDFVKSPNNENPAWVHVFGPPEAHVDWVLSSLQQSLAESHTTLFRLDAAFYPLNNPHKLQEILLTFFKKNRKPFEKLLDKYPTRVHYILQQVFSKSNPEYLQKGGYLNWLKHLFWILLITLSEQKQAILIVENCDENSQLLLEDFCSKLLTVTGKEKVMMVTTDSSPLTRIPEGFRIKQVEVKKISIRETEQFIKQTLNTSDLNARLFTNHIYLKSRGLPGLIGFFLSAYIKPILSSRTEEEIDTSVLKRVKVSPALDRVFPAILHQQTRSERLVLGFLSRLTNPLPLEGMKSILKNMNIPLKVYREWKQYLLVEEREFLGQQYVGIFYPPWKEFLAKQIKISELAPVLKALNTNVLRKAPVPLTISQLFFEVGDIESSLRLAYQEAQKFVQVGEFQRALDRLSFIRRNLNRSKELNIPISTILQEMGKIQRRMGLYENAFESFREARELLTSRERQEWMKISLEMAYLLYQMDSFSEARYLIQELKIKKGASPDLKSEIHILNGELEENSGHGDYALKHFEKVVPLLPKIRSQEIKLRLYHILKRFYFNQKKDITLYEKLMNQLIESIPEKSVERLFLQMEMMKWRIHQNQLSSVLPEVIAIYRGRSPGLRYDSIVQLRQLIGEIYGYFGKWYLAKAVLHQLLTWEALIPDFEHRCQLTVDLAVVEKELGCLGVSIQRLEEVLDQSRERNWGKLEHLSKLHLGHIYLMVYNMMRAREYLMATYQWALDVQDHELLLAAACLLSSYELNQGRIDRAREFLEMAESALAETENDVDQLNYYYYKMNYHLVCGEFLNAEKFGKKLLEESGDIVKFKYVAKWFLGKIALESGRFEEAEKAFNEALQTVRKCRLTYPQFQILLDLSRLFLAQNNTQLHQDYLDQANQVFTEFLAKVDDPILERQIQESRMFQPSQISKLS
ncbi:MAG: hypothetical protein D6748_03475 [Calditrichaeota bacterium]|nr:MAG: hypothetical protein D6748_03475 [Calditrichota bacterium]